MVGAALSLGACEEESNDDNSNTNNNGGGGGGSVSVENNTVVAGSDKGTVTKYAASIGQDVNTGGAEFIEIYCYDSNALSSTSGFRMNLHEIPAASTTLKWQSSGNAPGAIGPGEFIVQIKVDDQWWYAPFTSDGYDITGGEMQVTVNGDKITFAFEDTELADNLIMPNVTERRACGGKVTMLLSELQDLQNRPVENDLVDE